jgi:hypothetical protein
MNTTRVGEKYVYILILCVETEGDSAMERNIKPKRIIKLRKLCQYPAQKKVK